MKTMVSKINLYHEDENPIYGNTVTSFEIDDEGGGPFIVLKQYTSMGEQQIRLDIDEINDVYETLIYLKKIIKKNFAEANENDENTAE